MNETRAPTNEEIRAQVLEDYQNGEKPKALSEKTGISINTIKSWIKRDKAKKASAGKDAPKQKKGASSNKKRVRPLEIKMPREIVAAAHHFAIIMLKSMEHSVNFIGIL